MTTENIRRRVFRRMLAREAGTGADAPAIAAAARHACERFAKHLTPLIGDAGMAAICARSLHLTERNVRGLASVRASAQGDSCKTVFAALVAEKFLHVTSNGAFARLTEGPSLADVLSRRTLETEQRVTPAS